MPKLGTSVDIVYVNFQNRKLHYVHGSTYVVKSMENMHEAETVENDTKQFQCSIGEGGKE